MEYYKREELVMPEYGRGVQQMVNHAMTIEDREERMRCARTIIRVMGNMFPYLRDMDDFKHKLWDHLAAMSNYQLDIDYPYAIERKEPTNEKPIPPSYYASKVKYRHYGRLVIDMIELAVKTEPGEERDAFVLAIANQMKKQFVTWNKEQVSNAKIVEDLQELSNGTLTVDPDKLSDATAFAQKREGTFNSNYNKKNRKNRNRKNQGQ